jgi:hypothetical protein
VNAEQERVEAGACILLEQARTALCNKESVPLLTGVLRDLLAYCDATGADFDLALRRAQIHRNGDRERDRA